jgi:hypothetical protein
MIYRGGHMQSTSLVFSFLFATVLSCSSAAGNRGIKKEPVEIPTLTVCEALSHASEYNGKIVKIRGQVVATDEGASFLGESCPGIFASEGKVWPSAITWTMPTRTETILHPVDFFFDSESRKKLEKKWTQLLKGLPDRCIAVSYTGMFESWSPEGSCQTSLEMSPCLTH